MLWVQHNYMECTTDPMKLHLLELVGEGAFGVVHKACWRGCIVAAKVVPWPVGSNLCSKEMDNLK